MYLDINNINISIDSSVKHLTRTACMTLSGVIENGIILSDNQRPNIIIYKNRIDFGVCLNQELNGIEGLLPIPNFYKECNHIVYRYSSAYKFSFWSNTLDYVGSFAPTIPDNDQLYNLIYPKFA